MSKGKKLLIAFVFVIVLVGVGVAVTSLMGQKGDDGANADTDANIEAAATITYTQDGFDPSSVAVPSGSYIRVVNESDGMVGPTSDDSGGADKNTELNFSDAASGESVVTRVTAKGTWSIHNYYNNNHKATVIVE